jgi:hypothetical protein
MFFQADSINNLLICKTCDNKMVDPRLLPYGMSVCHRCVDIIADTDKKKRLNVRIVAKFMRYPTKVSTLIK